jgi:outer membrane protein TolC
MLRTTLCAALLNFTPLAVAAAPPEPLPDDPEALAAAALSRHPTLDARRAEVRALEAASSAARAWADPMLELEGEAGAMDREPAAGVRVVLSQPFPRPSESRARAALAEAATSAAEADVAVAGYELRAAVYDAYWTLAGLRWERAIVAAQSAALGRLWSAAEARYRRGEGGQTELLQLELRRSRLASRGDDLDAEALAVQSVLCCALGLAPDLPIVTPTAAPRGALPGDSGTRVGALSSHPTVAAFRATAAVARQERALATTGSAPSVAAWLGYAGRTPPAARAAPEALAIFGVAIALPAGSARVASASSAAASARADAAEKRAEAQLLELSSELAAAEQRFARARDRAALLRDRLEPLGDAALEAAAVALAAGRGTLSDLIRADLDRLELAEERVAAELDAERQRAIVLTLVSP